MPAKDILAANYAALKTRRITRAHEQREELNREMDAHRIEFEELLYRAVNDEGLKKRAAATIMNCSPQTVYDMLTRAAARHGVTALVDPFEDRFHWVPEGWLRITLTPAELLPSIAKYGWLEDTLKRAELAGHCSALFEVAKNGVVVPVKSGALADFEFLDRPVTLWVLANEAEVHEWIEAHPAPLEVAA